MAFLPDLPTLGSERSPSRLRPTENSVMCIWEHTISWDPLRPGVPLILKHWMYTIPFSYHCYWTQSTLHMKKHLLSSVIKTLVEQLSESNQYDGATVSTRSSPIVSYVCAFLHRTFYTSTPESKPESTMDRWIGQLSWSRPIIYGKRWCKQPWCESRQVTDTDHQPRWKGIL